MDSTKCAGWAITLLTIEEALEYLRISRAHLYPLLMSGQIKSVKIGRCRRISRGALHAFIEGGGVS